MYGRYAYDDDGGGLSRGARIAIGTCVSNEALLYLLLAVLSSC